MKERMLEGLERINAELAKQTIDTAAAERIREEYMAMCFLWAEACGTFSEWEKRLKEEHGDAYGAMMGTYGWENFVKTQREIKARMPEEWYE